MPNTIALKCYVTVLSEKQLLSVEKRSN